MCRKIKTVCAGCKAVQNTNWESCKGLQEELQDEPQDELQEEQPGVPANGDVCPSPDKMDMILNLSATTKRQAKVHQ